MDGFGEREKVRVGEQSESRGDEDGYAGGDTKEGKWADTAKAGRLNRVASRLQQSGSVDAKRRVYSSAGEARMHVRHQI
jgi:hypothetical protein